MCKSSRRLTVVTGFDEVVDVVVTIEDKGDDDDWEELEVVSAVVVTLSEVDVGVGSGDLEGVFDVVGGGGGGLGVGLLLLLGGGAGGEPKEVHGK